MDRSKAPPVKTSEPGVSRLRLLQALSDAENAWMNEVRLVFGERDAGLVRFQERGSGEPGSRLHDLYVAYVAARESYSGS